MTKIWAHRGASAYAPENTLPAFELAIAQGAEGVEFDVQLSADNELVVIHDETLERTTDGAGLVKDHDLKTLKRLNANAGRGGVPVRIPTLAEVLYLFAPTELDINIELKTSIVDYAGIEELTLELVDTLGLAERVVLSSFNHYTLHRAQRLGTECEIATLFTDPIYQPWEYSKDFGAAAIHPYLGHITAQAFVGESHAAGIKVRPWVADERADLLRMIGWGVDALFTDVPDIALEAKAEYAAQS
ncbi:MAG: glycerophosphodiester phosphodiesterase [Propionibacteriaceae bacterium]|jgi:glycerophosphoryl diester phosphodiesterase|nr:glycerophosphodiester phosphodiesterase [Propionibacteriaceae bacterium]